MILFEKFPYEKWSFATRNVMETLSPDQYNFLVIEQHIKDYKKGEVIFQQGHPLDGLYLMLNGMVKKSKDAGGGKEQILYIATAGELLGYHSIPTGDPYPDSAIAMEKSKIAFIPLEAFYHMKDSSAAFEQAYNRLSGKELSIIGNYASLGKSGHSEANLARALLVIGYKCNYDNTDKSVMEISISRHNLANLIDIAGDNVSRILGQFKASQLITSTGSKIRLLDIPKLIDLANAPFENIKN